MNNLFNRLKQNKAFKLTIVLIVVFFSFLIYFSKPKAETCVCSNWINCTFDLDEYGNQINKSCDCADTQYQDCIDGGGDDPICGLGEYVCNRPSGCCPYDSPPPETMPPGCDATSWSACDPSCGEGSQVNDCGTQQFCNDGPCCTPSCGGLICGDLGAVPNQVENILVNGEELGNLNLTSSPSLAITWDDPGTSDSFGAGTITYYTVQIWNKTLSGTGTSAPLPCDADFYCAEYDTAGKIESLTVDAISDHDNDIYVTVRAVNAFCGPADTEWGLPASAASYNLVANVGGDLYEDQSGGPDFNNNCNNTSTTAIDLSSYANSTVTAGSGGTPVNNPNTSFLLTDVPYAPTPSWLSHGFSLTLEIDNLDPLNSITCTCPVDLDPFSCAHTTTASPSLNEDIYLTAIDLSNGPWWQTSGGNIYGSSSLISSIPLTCVSEPLCSEYLITEDSDATPNSAGIPITGSSSVVALDGYFTERSAEPRAVDSDHNNLIKEDYSYFSRGVDLDAASEIIGGSITTLPTGATLDTDNTEVYFSDGDLTIGDSSSTGTENVTGSRKIVIFVNGNLTFTSDSDTEMINVDEGSFIGFIANGNITFGANLGNTSPTDTTSNIDGVFVADGTINVDGYSEAPTNSDALIDNKFVGEGTFVGWSGFNLNRDYYNTDNPLQQALNNINPIEIFTFRPDFNVNIPAIMMRPSLVWQEVN